VTESSPLADLIGKLEADGFNPRRGNGAQWSARCPAHEDRGPSLSCSEGDDGRALINCHAGCTTQAVMAALGLSLASLFPPGSREGHRSGRPASRTERTFGLDDSTFAMVPASIAVHACPLCVQVFAYLALRCGRQNVRQNGIAAIAAAIGCQPRTAALHVSHLAETGWLAYEATTTTTGAKRASRFWLRHLPAFGIKNPDVLLPSREHGVTGGTVARSTHYPGATPPKNGEGSASSAPVARSTRLTLGQVNALDALRSTRSTRSTSKAVARSTPDALGTWRYEQVGLGEREDDDQGSVELNREDLDELLEDEPDDDAPAPTDADIVDDWELLDDDDFDADFEVVA
jgi:hypothetical protein